MENAHDLEGITVRPAKTGSTKLSSRLALGALRLPSPLFALIDGGHFDDLPTQLTAHALVVRSLFLGQSGIDGQRHGPWMVTLRHSADVNIVLAIVGDLPAIVFWSCQAGDQALFNHLRRLNQAEIPRWAADGKFQPEPGNDVDLGREAVLFRHWDPTVLGAILPVLDEAQFSRIVGPAQQILFHAEDHSGTKRVVSDPTWPAPPPGHLKIRGEQIEALSSRLGDARRRRLATYLKEVAGPELEHVSPEALHQHVLASEASATQLGIATEHGQCRWVYLMYATNGDAARRLEVTSYICAGPETPDKRLEQLMAASIKHLQHRQSSNVQGPI